MKRYRVVVLGGYGFFGQHLVRRLSMQPALSIVIAGRSIEKASALAEELRTGSAAEVSAVHLDVQAADFAERLALLQPRAVVHAAGPFQGQDYSVARACIAAGAHYIDLADGRVFVTGIAQLNTQAVAAGVAVISGASSVPALSGAAVDHLAAGLADVASIDIGISPGNQTERGLSTVQSVLTYCGQPIPSGRLPAATGWLGTWLHSYAAPVGQRLLSPCDVPDLQIFPMRYPGGPVVRFGAGLELRLLHRGMNALAWMAHKGLVSNWSRHAKTLKAMSEWFIRWGSDAGAMHVKLQGRRHDSESVERLWELVALQGDGPYVPTLAAAALVHNLAAGAAITPGPKPCVGLLSLGDIVAQAAGLAITTSEREEPRPVSLFAAAMGPTYRRLDPTVRAFHDLRGHVVLHGTVHIEGPENWMGKVLARMTGSPRTTADGPMRFVLDSQPGQQVWLREFPGATMRSTMRLKNDALVETLGAARLTFDLVESAGSLDMQLRSMRFLGIPCPRWLMPRIAAREYADAGQLHFHIHAALPLVGRVAGYSGQLDMGQCERDSS
jgi:hypothetical protein